MIAIESVHLAQAKNYVVYNFPVGLLINFGSIRLEFKKVYNNHGNSYILKILIQTTISITIYPLSFRLFFRYR
ncbi:MAG: hypothetical protein LBC98_08170 [Prevotellaceae bacterium]|nr:hypothetical protein [Prevotellaceae bacterium]